MTFPVTRKSAVYAAASADAAERTWALDVIITAYWQPAYKYIRLKWNVSDEDAKDLTQTFFTRAYERNFFKDYDARRARFRTFLRICIDHFVANEKKFAARIKRGGDAQHVPLDFEIADPDEGFEREWMRNLFNMAIETLQQECELAGKMIHFLLFERYDLEESPATYEEMAAEFHIATTDVTNYLAWTRRQFRRIVLETRKQIDPS